MKIDAHQHFWQYNPLEYPWISNDLSLLQRDFMPSDLEPILAANSISGCIAVQARQTVQENHFLLSLAQKHPSIKGVVGWTDLRSDQIQADLETLSDNKKLVGLRHVLHDEKNDRYMLQRAFLNGIQNLEHHNLSYDMLIFPQHLKPALELVKTFPNQPFVIDHIAKPRITSGELDYWQKHIVAFKELENVYCKVSGMVTEAHWTNWKEDDFRPYMDTIVKTFGTNRIMYGSDWPVCLLAAEYSEVFGLVKNYFKAFTKAEQEQIFGLNCSRFYLKK